MQEARSRSLTEGLDAARAGAEAYDLARRLFPLPRSLTGDGVRETLRLVGEVVPLNVTEVPSGTPIFDWTVPREWNVADAWIAKESGRRIVVLCRNMDDDQRHRAIAQTVERIFDGRIDFKLAVLDFGSDILDPRNEFQIAAHQ